MTNFVGFEATEVIRREIDSNQQPAIIAITADAFKENAAKCLSSGMDDVVTKPIDKAVLVRKLLKYSNFRR
jgi:CheY-like chemotaxis protein